MTLQTDLSDGFNKLINNAGIKLRIDYYSGTYDTVYDEIGSLSIYSSIWTSGIVLPLSNTPGTSEAVLVQQGLLRSNDQRLFISGGITLSNNADLIKIQLGSPTGNKYSIITEGIKASQVAGVNIFKKVYITKVETGSFYSE